MPTLDWTREEIILAMDFYVRVGGLTGGTISDDNSAEIHHLSALLKRLGAYPPELRGERYRNPNGVHLKLMNLRAVQTDRAHGMPAHSQLDAAVWRDYIDDLPRLHEEAQAIRARLDDGSIQPARRGRSLVLSATRPLNTEDLRLLWLGRAC